MDRPGPHPRMTRAARHAPRDVSAVKTALAVSDGTPVWLDIPVWATRLPDPNRDGRIRVRLSAEGGDALGTAFVYRNRWYPG